MKKNILIFLLGGLFFSCISVYATIYYDASQINYKTTTLDHAIDDLYSTQNTTVTNLQSTITNLNSSVNTLQTTLNNYKTFNITFCVEANQTGFLNINSGLVQRYPKFTIGNPWGSSTNYSTKLLDDSHNVIYTVTPFTKYNMSEFAKIKLSNATSGYICEVVYFSND